MNLFIYLSLEFWLLCFEIFVKNVAGKFHSYGYRFCINLKFSHSHLVLTLEEIVGFYTTLLIFIIPFFISFRFLGKDLNGFCISYRHHK